MRLPTRINRAAKLSVSILLCLVTIASAQEDLESRVHNDNFLADNTKNSEDDDQDLSISDESHFYAVNVPSSSSPEDTCNEDRIMEYLAEIQVINPETILQIASYENVATACRKVEATLRAMDAWMLGCNPPPSTNMYMRLTDGLRILDKELCAQTDYRQNYKENLECYKQLHNEYLDCEGPADWIVIMEGHELCNQYKEIADCYYKRTAILCGMEAAETMKEFVVSVINAVVQTHCPVVKLNPAVADLITDHDVYARTSSSNKIRSYLNLYVSLLLSNHVFIF